MHGIEVVLPAPVAPHQLVVRPRPIPVPGPGEVLLRVLATGVSFDDMMMRRGSCAGVPPFPVVPGRDVIGVVERAGEGAEPGPAGQRVAAVLPSGGWASHVVLPAAGLVPVPEPLGTVEAAALAYPGVLAWYMLHEVARVRAGQTIVVPGAPGWVGTTLVQLATAMGVRVIGVSSTRQLAETSGLEFAPVDHWTEDVSKRVAELAPDGVDAVFDTIGGPNLRESWDQLTGEGILVSYGSFATRDQPGDAAARHLELTAMFASWQQEQPGRRATVVDLFADGAPAPATVHTALSPVFAAAAEGRLRPFVASVHPLTDAATSLAAFEVGGLVGRPVLTVPLDRDSSAAS
jgi:NADPH:quinone reductase-like Zn-dependent oxidoreductase